MKNNRNIKFAVGLVTAAMAFALANGGIAYADDTPGTATITGGTLTMTTPATVDFSATLTGADQVVSAPQAIDIIDSTGSGAGWNVTLTTTTFTSGAHTLDTTSLSDTAASGACDASVTCTGAISELNYPITVPAAATAPVAGKIMNAGANTGMGGQTWTHTMHLALPASVYSGTYTSTWTYSLVSAP